MLPRQRNGAQIQENPLKPIEALYLLCQGSLWATRPDHLAELMYYLAMVYLVPWSHYLTKSFCIVSKLPDGRIWTWRWGPLSASLSLAKLPPNKAPSHPSVDTHLQVLAHVSYFKSRNEFTGGEFHQNTVCPFCPAVHNMPMARYTFLD